MAIALQESSLNLTKKGRAFPPSFHNFKKRELLALDEGKVDEEQFAELEKEYLNSEDPKKKPIPLRKFIKNKMLFKVCPFLKKVKVYFARKDDPRDFGLYKPIEKEIEINSNIHKKEKARTLLHETQHAIDIDCYTGGNISSIQELIETAKEAKDTIDKGIHKSLLHSAKSFYKKFKEAYGIDDEILKRYDSLLLAKAIYFTHTGEIMARNSANRNIKFSDKKKVYIEYDPIKRKTLTISGTEDIIARKIYITNPIYSDLKVLKNAFIYEKNGKTHRNISIYRQKGNTKNNSINSTYTEEESFNYSLQARDELDAKHRDLYERYKEGDQEAYQEAVEIVKADALSFNLHKKRELS